MELLLGFIPHFSALEVSGGPTPPGALANSSAPLLGCSSGPDTNTELQWTDVDGMLSTEYDNSHTKPGLSPLVTRHSQLPNLYKPRNSKVSNPWNTRLQNHSLDSSSTVVGK